MHDLFSLSRLTVLRFSGSEGLFFDDAFAFLDGYDLSGGNIGEILSFAVEPRMDRLAEAALPRPKCNRKSLCEI